MKERVLKEYESGGSGVTCQRFRRKVANSLPDWLKEAKLENDQTGDSQFEVLFPPTVKRTANRASLAKSGVANCGSVRRRFNKLGVNYPSLIVFDCVSLRFP